MSAQPTTVQQYQALPVADQDPAAFRAIVLGAAASAAAARAAIAKATGAVAKTGSVSARKAANASTVILAALMAFIGRRQVADAKMLHVLLVRQMDAQRVTGLDVTPLLEHEAQRAQAFADASRARVAASLPQILGMTDPAVRTDALRRIMAREARYQQQHVEAAAARVLGGLNSLIVKQQSPDGALWKLSPYVREHTAGCLRMGGKPWPWVVLDRVHPPRHVACPCRLHGYDEAIANGWMRSGDVPSDSQAVDMAAGVVMESLAPVLDLQLRLGPLREALAARGLDVVEFDRLAGVAA